MKSENPIHLMGKRKIESVTFWLDMINIKHNNQLLGIMSYLTFGGIVSFPHLWPYEIDVVLDSMFWTGLFMFVFSCFVIYYLFQTGGCSNRNVRFTFGLLIVVAAATMNSCFEIIDENTDNGTLGAL